MIELPSNKNIYNILKEPKKLIIWCGSGVSALSPSSLPLGKQLVDYFMEQFISREFVNELYKRWNDINYILSKNNFKSLGACPRLESVISEIQLIKEYIKNDNKGDLKFESAFKTFSDAPFNIIHAYIAFFVLSGATVVTTNYDLCIENAISCIHPESKYVCSDKSRGVYKYSSSKEIGEIYHIHGIASEPENIGVSYNTVSREFPEFFESQLDGWIENDYTFLFLGYSCSDNYDVEKYFNNINNRYIKSTATALFVQHGDLSNPKELNSNVVDLLNYFIAPKAITMKTKDFLEIGISDKDKNMLSQLVINKCFDWKENFSSNIYITEKIKDIVLLRLSYLFGINTLSVLNVNTIDVLNRSCNENAPIKQTFSSYLKLLLYKELWEIEKCKTIVMNNDSFIDSSKESDERLYSSRKDYNINHILDMEGNYQELFERLPSTDWLLKNINEKIDIPLYRLGWEISSPIHQYIKILLKTWSDNLIGKCNKDLLSSKTIRDLLKCLNYIINLPFNTLEHVDQVSVALRCRAIISTYQYGINKKEDIIKDLHYAIDLYSKESSIDGLCQCIILLSYVNMIFFVQTKDYNYLIESQKDIDCAQKIAESACNYKLLHRIKVVSEWENDVYMNYYNK